MGFKLKSPGHTWNSASDFKAFIALAAGKSGQRGNGCGKILGVQKVRYLEFVFKEKTTQDFEISLPLRKKV